MAGALVVLDGPDGTGKTTQHERLHKRLEELGVAFKPVDFPQYGTPSAWFIEQYLNGELGDIDEIGPYRGSIFFAIDRYQASASMWAALTEGKFLLANRYVAANMGHQGAKIATADERAIYFRWLDDLEYTIMGIPQPTLNIILELPADIAQRRVDEKAERAYLGGRKRDLHEENLDHLRKAGEVYREICDLWPERFVRVDASGSEKEVHERIGAHVQPLLNGEAVA
jgi:dTMP kinase